jgi:hypothetical protein
MLSLHCCVTAAVPFTQSLWVCVRNRQQVRNRQFSPGKVHPDFDTQDLIRLLSNRSDCGPGPKAVHVAWYSVLYQHWESEDGSSGACWRASLWRAQVQYLTLAQHCHKASRQTMVLACVMGCDVALDVAMQHQCRRTTTASFTLIVVSNLWLKQSVAGRAAGSNWKACSL